MYGLLVENNATNAVVDAKGVPELLMPFIKGQVKVIEEDGSFNVYVVDPQGDRRYSGITGQPMNIKELVMEMKANEKVRAFIRIRGTNRRWYAAWQW